MQRLRDERGVSTVIIALFMVALLASAGLAIDISNLTYQRSRAQNGADNAALAVARQCALDLGNAACTSPKSTADYYVGENAGGNVGDVTVSKPSSQEVRVDVKRDIGMSFLSIFPDFSTRPVEASATARWDLHPTTGFPVLPLGVAYCTWSRHQALVPEGNPSDRIAIRTDLLQGVSDLLSTVTGTAAAVVDLQGLLGALGADSTETCKDGSNDIVTLKGGVWLTGNNVVWDTLTGLFKVPAGQCDIQIGNDLKTFVGGLSGSAFLPPGCPSKFGKNKPVDVGKTILLPVYKPNTTATNTLGLKLDVCGGIGLGARSCVKLPPQIGVKIVGYAPFKITGWKYPAGTSNPDPSVSCFETKPSLNLRSVVYGLLSPLERIANALLLTVLGLLGPSQNGNLTTTLGCNGIQGYFVKTTTPDPLFQYGTAGEYLGNNNVRLSE